MFENLFTPIFTSTFDATSFIICTLTSLTLGSLLALIHNKLNKSNISMLLTIVLLPFVVQIVLMLVNGNVGTGIAIAGAFGLIRFRSIQCRPEEIIIIFAATAIGLATSAGYIGVAIIFTFIIVILIFMFSLLTSNSILKQHKELRITVPERINYADELAEVLDKYNSYFNLLSVRTTNMGSLYKLTYDIIMKNERQTQEFINDLRIHNGNLEIFIGLLPEVGE